MSSPACITPRFVSVWDGGTEIETPCTVDFATGIVSPEVASDGAESLVTTLDSQHVMFGEFSIEVTDEDGQIRVARPTELPVIALFAASLEELPDYLDLESFLEHATNPAANTMIGYQYRDGANYKKYAEVVFKGVIIPAQINIIRQNFFKEFEPTEPDFLPRQVGLRPLCPATHDDNYDDDIDHMIHTLESIKLVTQPANAEMLITDLCNNFAAAGTEGWDMVKYGNEYH